ncbi:hypothetical protein DYBT9275_03851 [Dyadobacter sp. CECT 9275]|uniref:Endonuclease GajA/Old nuclease/RecF-like AAA domain-containing protein n=1 Tax=Dyadobacter helix TaxID=2822344 RepID=A0A916N5S2_9BACT|nr:hypothetical protein DYBT9275_03851 [Dyadobacter sp. CECT 9275]
MVNYRVEYATKVKFEVTPPAFEDLLKNFTTSVDDGIETSAEEKGDGMQRALMLAIIQAYSDFRKRNDDVGKSFLFLIDEAELHLHPTAQRKLKNVLHSLALGSDQVFINTHSSVFVADNLENQSLFRAEKTEGVTDVFPVDQASKPYVVFELLGGSPADILMPQNFLIVEGLSEYELLSRVIRRIYPGKPIVQILQANGDIDQAERTINAIEKAFTPINASIYRNKTVLMLDLPSAAKQGGFDQFVHNNRHLRDNRQIYILAMRDIEQCYPDKVCGTYGNWKKTQEECDAMNGKKKKQLAKHVGNTISKDEFEQNLGVCFDALNRCWELSFSI